MDISVLPKYNSCSWVMTMCNDVIVSNTIAQLMYKSRPSINTISKSETLLRERCASIKTYMQGVETAWFPNFPHKEFPLRVLVWHTLYCVTLCWNLLLPLPYVWVATVLSIPWKAHSVIVYVVTRLDVVRSRSLNVESSFSCVCHYMTTLVGSNCLISLSWS